MYLAELIIDQGPSLIITAGVLLSLGIVEWANRHYRKTTAKYSGLVSRCSLPGHSVAERLLKRLGIAEVTVHRRGAKNIYAPWRRQIQLTDAAYDAPTVWSLASAAHEVGHAEQFATGFRAARLWRLATPISFVLMVAAVVWSMLLICGVVDTLFVTGDIVAPLLFGLIVLLQIPVHLPLERDASQRARRYVREEGIISDEELPIFDELLDAAWKTHLAQNIQRWLIVGVLFVLMGLAPTLLKSACSSEDDFAATPDFAAYGPTSFTSESQVPPLPWDFAPPGSDRQQTPFNSAAHPEQDVLVIGPLDCLRLMFSDVYSILGLVTIVGLCFLVCRLPKPFTHRPTSEELALQYNNRASEHQLNGQSEAAIEDFSRCLELNPEFTIGWSNRGQAFVTLGKFTEAMADFNRALELAPHFADALGGRAYACACLGEFEAALNDCNRALETNPESGSLWFVRGTVHRGLDRHTEAIADFSKAIELDVAHAPSYRERGLERLLTDDLEAALDDTQHALRLDPQDVIALNNRGAILIRLGRFVEAIADLNASLKIQPNFAWPYKHLAWIRATCPDATLRDGEQAVSDALRALKLTEWKQEQWIEVLAAAHAESGDFDEACRWQKKWIASAPANRLIESQSRLARYESKLPLRDSPGNSH